MIVESYCPCNGKCHHSPNPCSIDCLSTINRILEKHYPWGPEGYCVCGFFPYSQKHADFPKGSGPGGWNDSDWAAINGGEIPEA